MFRFLMLLISLMLLIAGVYMLLKGIFRIKSEKVLSRFEHYEVAQVKTTQQSNFLINEMQRLGVDLSPAKVAALVLMIALLAYLVSLFLSTVGALFVIVFSPALLYLFTKIRYQKRLARMVQQLPIFLDHSVRSLASGRSLTSAIISAMDSAPVPLGEAFVKTRRQVEHGITIQDAMTDFADFYKREEFRILALGLRVNAQYGGNASDLLKSLIVLIRDKDKMVRSLRAMTGETRLSAIVLASMPAGLAIYLLLTNPSFFMGLWNDSFGKVLLFVAFGLQVVGSFIMWRMLRSIK